MRHTSRTICAGLLVLGLALAAGCNSKPSGDQPNVAIQPEPKADPKGAGNTGGDPRPGTGGGDPKVDPPPPKATHEMDPARHVVPPLPVAGFVGGAEVALKAAVEGDDLIFQTTKPGTANPERRVSLKLIGPAARSFENRRLTINPLTPRGADVPEVMILTPLRDVPEFYTNGYALTLELGTRKAGKIPGKVYLSFPDPEKTFLAGTFEADYQRPPTEPPGPDDAPYVRGDVVVRGAAPNAALVVGYAAHPAPDPWYLGVAEIRLGEPVVPPRWVHADHDKPRITTLVAGDGKNVPAKYEHTKLSTGRHLVFAATAGGGPVVWQWVEVGKNATLTLDLTLDLTKAGGLEVTVPLEVLGKVQLAPADEPGRPAMPKELFVGVAMQLRLEQDIVARKALFKNLAPGKYEARAGGQSRTVEVVAGKTIELDFGKK